MSKLIDYKRILGFHKIPEEAAAWAHHNNPGASRCVDCRNRGLSTGSLYLHTVLTLYLYVSLSYFRGSCEIIVIILYGCI